jgi:hypothetical protein
MMWPELCPLFCGVCGFFFWQVVCSEECRFQQNFGYSIGDTWNRQCHMQDLVHHTCKEWCKHHEEWMAFRAITPCPECDTRTEQHIQGCRMKTVMIDNEIQMVSHINKDHDSDVDDD